MEGEALERKARPHGPAGRERGRKKGTDICRIPGRKKKRNVFILIRGGEARTKNGQGSGGRVPVQKGDERIACSILTGKISVLPSCNNDEVQAAAKKKKRKKKKMGNRTA